MSERISAKLVRLVRERAGEICEYCRLPQSSQEAVFHIDHIRPRVDGGETVEGNLALACVTCSLKKAARTHVRDPRSEQLVPVFSPRREQWTDHFRWGLGYRIVGRTACGRATVKALGMNRPAVLAIRKGLAKLAKL